MKPWIKGGIITAIVYTVLNIILFYWGMPCGYDSGNNAVCPIVEWSYWNLFFFDEQLEYVLPRSPSPGIWMLTMIVIDAIIGFIVGALVTLGIGTLRSSKQS